MIDEINRITLLDNNVNPTSLEFSNEMTTLKIIAEMQSKINQVVESLNSWNKNANEYTDEKTNKIISDFEKLKSDFESGMLVKDNSVGFEKLNGDVRKFINREVTEQINEIMKVINFGLTDEGQLYADIPDCWNDIHFGVNENDELVMYIDDGKKEITFEDFKNVTIESLHNELIGLEEVVENIKNKYQNEMSKIQELEINNTILKNNIKSLEYVIDNSNRLEMQGTQIVNTNSIKGDIKNVKICGNSLYKWSDNTITDTWKVCGKNLCKTNSATQISFNSLADKLKEGKVYTISGVSNVEGKIAHGVIYKADGTKTIYDSNLPLSFTYSNDLSYVVFIADVTWESLSVKNLQVEQGVSSSYEPYKYINELISVGSNEKNSDGKYPIEIVSCGKNLFSTELFDTIKSITHCQNCSWNKSTGVLHLQWDGIVTYPILLKPKVKENTQYVLSFEIQSETNWTPNGIRIKYTDGSESYPSATLSTSTDFQKVATKTTANKTIAYIYWVGNNNINIKNIQLELSDDFTTYEPYKENKRTILLDSPLRKVGEVADVLDLNNSQVIRKCSSVILDGSSDENWTYAGNNIFALPFSGYKKVDLTTNSLLICDKFTVTSHNVVNNISGNYIAFESSYTNDNYIKIRKTDITDLATFKTWLANNPVTIVYELDTPVVETVVIKPTDNPLTSYNNSTTLTLNNTIKGNISADIPSNVNAIIVNQASAIASLQDTVLQTQSALIENEYNNLI